MNITADEAQRLINQLDAILGNREALFRTAYEMGFNAGRDVGYAQAKHEEEQDWAALTAHVQSLGTSDAKTHTEMELRRWGGPRADYGKPRPGDYPGGPCDWETGQPLPPEQPAKRDPRAPLPAANAPEAAA